MVVLFFQDHSQLLTRQAFLPFDLFRYNYVNGKLCVIAYYGKPANNERKLDNDHKIAYLQSLSLLSPSLFHVGVESHLKHFLNIPSPDIEG